MPVAYITGTTGTVCSLSVFEEQRRSHEDHAAPTVEPPLLSYLAASASRIGEIPATTVYIAKESSTYLPRDGPKIPLAP
jgi:hypothetical protein